MLTGQVGCRLIILDNGLVQGDEVNVGQERQVINGELIRELILVGWEEFAWN